MPKFLDTSGRSTLGIGVCGRCGCKMSLEELMSDPNYPGLKVCADDIDDLDPYRLPARQTEEINLEFTRPDLSLTGNAPMPVYTNQINGIAQVLANVPWAPNAVYAKGATVTPVNPNDENVTLPIPQFLALTGGTSGALPPAWPTHDGQIIFDNGIQWMCTGIWIS